MQLPFELANQSELRVEATPTLDAQTQRPRSRNTYQQPELGKEVNL